MLRRRRPQLRLIYRGREVRRVGVSTAAGRENLPIGKHRQIQTSAERTWTPPPSTTATAGSCPERMSWRRKVALVVSGSGPCLDDLSRKVHGGAVAVAYVGIDVRPRLGADVENAAPDRLIVLARNQRAPSGKTKTWG